MTRHRHAARSIAAAVAIAGLMAACGRPQTIPVPPATTDTIVLAGDPETAVAGRAVVQSQGVSVELEADGAVTRVTTSRAPEAPTMMAPEEVQRRFGSAMAARPPEPLHVLLYFDLGGDTLTAASQAELLRTVDLVRQRPVPDVTVIGHTDTTGGPARNVTVGLQRATLVRSQLIAVGVPPEQIDATSHGEFDLLVSTEDNVSEERNRRVEITIR